MLNIRTGRSSRLYVINLQMKIETLMKDERQNEKSELVWVESSYHHLSILAIHEIHHNRHFCSRKSIIGGTECYEHSKRKKINELSGNIV